MFCYLCGDPITEEQQANHQVNRDHVPPLRIYAKQIRRQYPTQLDTLPTHVACNTAYRQDEEYFVMVMAGHHSMSWTAKAVWEDIAHSIATKGSWGGLIRSILSKFGKVTTADGSRLFELDMNRATRVVWKIVRGLYTLETGRLLPDESYRNIEIVIRSEADKTLPNHLWFNDVARTEGMAKHKAVFDYRWVCRYIEDGQVDITDCKGNLMFMIMWDNLILLCLFHDPACRCHRCKVLPGRN